MSELSAFKSLVLLPSSSYFRAIDAIAATACFRHEMQVIR